MIFCTAKDGIAVGAERCWKYLKSENIPCLFYISKTDEDHGDFAGVLSALQDKYGSAVCAGHRAKGNKTEKIAVPAADAVFAARDVSCFLRRHRQVSRQTLRPSAAAIVGPARPPRSTAEASTRTALRRYRSTVGKYSFINGMEATGEHRVPYVHHVRQEEH